MTTAGKAEASLCLIASAGIFVEQRPISKLRCQRRFRRYPVRRGAWSEGRRREEARRGYCEEAGAHGPALPSNHHRRDLELTFFQTDFDKICSKICSKISAVIVSFLKRKPSARKERISCSHLSEVIITILASLLSKSL